jgi:phage antirepressor YoqD-like protein
MSNLTTIITINPISFGNNQINAISAKALYEALELDLSHYARWTQMNIVENQFASNHEDWEGFAIMANGNSTTDYMLSIPFAKKLSMMVQTFKGEEVRNYFIECEKQAISSFNIPKTLPEALRAYADTLEENNKLTEALSAAQPAISFTEAVTNNKGLRGLRDYAKIIHKKPNIFMATLRNDGYLYKNKNGENVPYQTYLNAGYFEVKEGINPRGFKWTKTVVTGKGEVYLQGKYK